MPIEATNELYINCKGTIEKACWNAWNRNPIISLDDYRSYADEIFMDAVRSFNPEAGTKFNSWLTTQLLRLKPYAARWKMSTDSRGVAESLVLSLDEKHETDYGKMVSLHEVIQPVNDMYSVSLSTPDWAVSWENRMKELKPYFGELSSDARTLVDNILDGDVSKKDKEGVPVPESGKIYYSKLSPRQLYVRLYKRLGWGFERVRDARIEVEKMLRKWSPCNLPESAAEVQVQDDLF